MKKFLFALFTIIILIISCIKPVNAGTQIIWKGCGYSMTYNEYLLNGTKFRVKFGYDSDTETIATLSHLPVLFPISRGYTQPLHYEEVKPQICNGNLPKYIQVSWKGRYKTSACYVKYLDSKTKKWKCVKISKNRQKIKLYLRKITKKKNVGKTVLKIIYKFKTNDTVIRRCINISYWKDCLLNEVSIKS